MASAETINFWFNFRIRTLWNFITSIISISFCDFIDEFLILKKIRTSHFLIRKFLSHKMTLNWYTHSDEQFEWVFMMQLIWRALITKKKNVAMSIRFLYKQKLCVPCKKCKFDLENLHAKKLQCQQLFLFFLYPDILMQKWASENWQWHWNLRAIGADFLSSESEWPACHAPSGIKSFSS